MDDILNDPRFPNRPNHADFWRLANIVLGLDGGAGGPECAAGDETPDEFFQRTLEEIVDVESLMYVASQRAMRMIGITHGDAPDLDSLDGPLLERNRVALTTTTVAYLEAFVVGAMFAAKKETT